MTQTTITVRKIGAQTAHLATQSGTWAGAPLFTHTLCAREIRPNDWAEVHDGTGWSRIVGVGPAFLLQPCQRCQTKADRS